MFGATTQIEHKQDRASCDQHDRTNPPKSAHARRYQAFLRSRNSYENRELNESGNQEAKKNPVAYYSFESGKEEGRSDISLRNILEEMNA